MSKVHKKSGPEHRPNKQHASKHAQGAMPRFATTGSKVSCSFSALQICKDHTPRAIHPWTASGKHEWHGVVCQRFTGITI
eukprot:1158309-Pelagomonas_calceolata.AAC.8